MSFRTHEVENQPQALPEGNLWGRDLPLREAVTREGGGWAAEHLQAYGALAGGELMALGELANTHRPRLRAFDRYGRRLDDVDFHPAYHQLMRLAMRHGVHAYSWQHEATPGAHVARAALMYLSTQPDAGTCCPLTMTHAAVPTLRLQPALAAEWLPRLAGAEYDERPLPATRKSACTIGMGMTEKQGGSDVRSNRTRATRLADGSYELVGHKWFFSAPMSDAHLVLAQAEGGLSCFLLPRILPDGSNNAVRIQRLKEKLGDWSNASAEVEFEGAHALLVGEEGRGIPTIIEMVALTRLDCLTGSAGLMRQGLVQALHHARHRRAFGKRLVEQPLMRNVLADLALESEAAVGLAMRVARAVDAAPRDPREAAFARVATALGKYWVCKRCPPFVNEAQECLGGIGYVEENILPRLYRQAPLNSIWEGSGNVQCLDVLRAVAREPGVREALFAELRVARGANALLDREVDGLDRDLAEPDALESRSRYLVERIAMALQASILLRAGEDAVADGFCAARLRDRPGLAFGACPVQQSATAILDRVLPPS